MQAIYTDAIFAKSRDEYIGADILNIAIEYGGYGKEEIKFSNTKLSFYIDGIRCSVDSNKGVKAVTDITDTSVIKIIYDISKNSKLELSLTKSEGVHIKSVYLNK